MIQLWCYSVGGHDMHVPVRGVNKEVWDALKEAQQSSSQTPTPTVRRNFYRVCRKRKGIHASRHNLAHTYDRSVRVPVPKTCVRAACPFSRTCAIPRNMSTVLRMKYRSWGYSSTELSLSTLLSEKGLKSSPLIVRVSNITSASFSMLSASSGLLNFTPSPLKLFTEAGKGGGYSLR